MGSRFPISFLFFAAAAAGVLLQLIPFVNIILFFLFAPYWSAVLINMGMLGTTFEALTTPRFRYWLFLPVAFYAGYWVVALWEWHTFRTLTAAYQTANANIETGYDPTQHALTFESQTEASWFAKNFDIAPVYFVQPKYPEGYGSYQLVSKEIFELGIFDRGSLASKHIVLSPVFKLPPSNMKQRDERLQLLSRPENPALPAVLITKRKAQSRYAGSLPITTHSTLVRLPETREFEVVNMTASRLPWYPLPVIYCAPTFSRKGTECRAEFGRQKRSSVGNRPRLSVAEALGLRPTTQESRKAVDPQPILAHLNALDAAVLAEQIKHLTALASNPRSSERLLDARALEDRTSVLIANAELIITGLERAAKVSGPETEHAKLVAYDLVQLLRRLPPDVLYLHRNRLIALYARAHEDHWLWVHPNVIAELGYLGKDALPILTKSRLWQQDSKVLHAAVVAACRLGASARSDFEPLLLSLWLSLADSNLQRPTIFVTMRRLGISPPEYGDDQTGRHKNLKREWADITPQSPPRVCMVNAERSARKRNKTRSRTTP